MKLQFKCLLPEVANEMPIEKCKPSYFKWYQKVVDDYRKKPKSLHTAKCPGIFGILKQGWVQRTYQDVTIETFPNNQKDVKWKSPFNQRQLKYLHIKYPYLGTHSKEQLRKFKDFKVNTLDTIMKVQSPWFVKIPEEYFLLSMPIPYNDDVRFTAATGLLSGINFLNVQLYWHVLGKKEVIKKGTPLCQYVLIAKKELPYECGVATDIDVKELIQATA